MRIRTAIKLVCLARRGPRKILIGVCTRLDFDIWFCMNQELMSTLILLFSPWYRMIQRSKCTASLCLLLFLFHSASILHLFSSEFVEKILLNNCDLWKNVYIYSHVPTYLFFTWNSSRKIPVSLKWTKHVTIKTLSILILS